MNEHLFLVEPSGRGSRAFAALRTSRLRSEAEVRRELDRPARRSLWVAPTDAAVRLLVRSSAGRSRGDQRLLSLPSSGNGHALLHVTFRHVVSPADGATLLALEELIDVLGSEHPEELIVAAALADPALILYRGDLEPLVVPLRWFRWTRGGPRPDPRKLAIIDGGQTVRLGSYEAATDAILYDFDPAYRVRAKKRAVERDSSFGGALRRLRIQKGLRRTDFPNLTSREIARIERGEVSRPRRRTLAILARRLGVPAETIATY